VVGIFIAVVVVAALVGFVYYFHEGDNSDENDYSDRCLIASGYYWDAAENACIKSGLEKGDEGWYQVDNFKKCVAAGYPILNTNPRQCDTPREDVFFDDIIEDVIDNFDKCETAGYPIMESDPRQCKLEDGTLFVEGY